jgi:hypothetical protein
MTKSFKKFRESTSAYKKSLAKIADKKKKAGMSSSDQNKMGKLAALMKKQKREDVEYVDEGVGGYSLKRGKTSVIKGKGDGDDISITQYDILLKGKKVGEIKHNNYYGNIDGKLNGKELPDLEKYGKNTSGALGALHGFLKTSQGKKFVSESVEQIDEGVSSNLKKFKKTVVQKKKDYKYDKKNAAYLKRSRARDQKEIDLVVKGDSRSKNGKSDNPHKAAHIKRALARADSRIKNWKLPRLPEEVEQIDEARAPSTVKHKGKTYYQTGKKGKDMKTGHPSFEYSSDMDGDDVRVWYNTRTKQLKMESVDEALSHAQRIKASLRMKKMKSRIKIGRERAMRKTPNMDVVKKRAFRQARLAVLKKMTKGMDKSDVSFAKRQDLEKRLDKKRPLIQRLAKRLIPNVRKADRARRASKGEK